MKNLFYINGKNINFLIFYHFYFHIFFQKVMSDLRELLDVKVTHPHAVIKQINKDEIPFKSEEIGFNYLSEKNIKFRFFMKKATKSLKPQQGKDLFLIKKMVQ